MEQLISEIEAFCAETGMTPQTVLRRSAGYGWGVWENWKSGKSVCTLKTAQKVRSFIHIQSLSLSGRGAPASHRTARDSNPTVQPSPQKSAEGAV